MATFHMSIKSGKKGTAANHAAYIARDGKHGTKGKREDLVASITGNLPAWANGNPLEFWKAADRYERRNGAAYREYELALPGELSFEQNNELLNEFIIKHVGDRPFQLAMHMPTAALGGVPQPHGHLMISGRMPDGISRPPEKYFKRYNSANPEAGGCKKDSGGKSRQEMREQAISIREDWAGLQNAYLAKYGHDARVDHRSNKARGIASQPEKHLGHVGIKKMSDEEREEFKAERLRRKVA